MIWLILISAGVVTFITLFLTTLFRSDIIDKLWKLMGKVVYITGLVFALGFWISFWYTGYAVSHMTAYSEQATLAKTENLENLQSVTENDNSIYGNIFCFYGQENSEYYYSIMKWENDYLVTDRIKADDVKIKYTGSEEIPHIDTYEYREYLVEKKL